MNKNIKTLTLIKFILKRPFILLRKLLVKINSLTTNGVVGYLFKVIRYSSLILGIAGFIAYYFFNIKLDEWFTLANLLIFNLISRTQGSLKRLLDLLNDLLSTKEEVNLPDPNISKTSSEDSQTQGDSSPSVENKVPETNSDNTIHEEWEPGATLTIEQWEKIKELLESKDTPKEIKDSLRKTYMLPTDDTDNRWIKHPYIFSLVITGAVVALILYYNSDGSLGSMGSTAGAWFTAITGYLSGIKPKANVELNSETEVVNQSETNISFTTLESLELDKKRYENKLSNFNKLSTEISDKVEHNKELLRSPTLSDNLTSKVQKDLGELIGKSDKLLRKAEGYNSKLNEINEKINEFKSDPVNIGRAEVTQKWNSPTSISDTPLSPILPLSPVDVNAIAPELSGWEAESDIRNILSPQASTSTLPESTLLGSTELTPKSTNSVLPSIGETSNSTVSESSTTPDMSYPPKPQSLSTDVIEAGVNGKEAILAKKSFNTIPKNTDILQELVSLGQQLSSTKDISSTTSTLDSSTSPKFSSTVDKSSTNSTDDIAKTGLLASILAYFKGSPDKPKPKKYMEIYNPHIEDYVFICEDDLTDDDYRDMEKLEIMSYDSIKLRVPEEYIVYYYNLYFLLDLPVPLALHQVVHDIVDEDFK